MRRKKKSIRIEREARIDPRETHRKHAERYVPPPLREHSTKSETTEEPSRLPVTGVKEHARRQNDMTAAHRHRRTQRMGKRRGRRRD